MCWYPIIIYLSMYLKTYLRVLYLKTYLLK